MRPTWEERTARFQRRAGFPMLDGRIEGARRVQPVGKGELVSRGDLATGGKRYSTIVVAPSNSTHTDGADFVLPGDSGDSAVLQDAADAAGDGEVLVLDGLVHLTDQVGGDGILRGVGGGEGGDGTSFVFPRNVGDGYFLLSFDAFRDFYITDDGAGVTPSSDLTVLNVGREASSIVSNLSPGDGSRLISCGSSGAKRVLVCELSLADGWTGIRIGVNPDGVSVADTWLGYGDVGIEARSSGDYCSRIHDNTIRSCLKALWGKGRTNFHDNHVTDCGDGGGGAIYLDSGGARIHDNVFVGGSGDAIYNNAGSQSHVYNNPGIAGSYYDPSALLILNNDGSADDWNQ